MSETTAPYGSGSTPPPSAPKRVRIPHLQAMTDRGERWAMLTAYDMYTAAIFDEAGIPVVTLYMLSTENLRRPAEELAPLLEIIQTTAERLAQSAEDRAPVCVQPVGAVDLLPEPMARRLAEVAEQTKDHDGVHVNVAVGYGGRQEILDAVRELLRDEHALGHSAAEVAESVTVEQIADRLYTRGQPDPDLVIRTSGEQRLSGFLLWQSAYSEFYFCEAMWPAFRKVDFLRALRDYGSRQRRFGT